MYKPTDFIIARDKIEQYLLKPGSENFKEFIDAGYTVNDVELLQQHIQQQFNINLATDFRAMHNNAIHFSIFMDLGVIGQEKRFRTVWRKDTPESIPRFITAHRE